MPRSAAPLFTYEDLARLPEDGKRREVLGGALVVNASPRLRHQHVVMGLAVQLHRVVREEGLGVVFGSPVDVELSEHDIVEPDVVVVLNDRCEILRESRVIGAPSLVVEVLSPSTASVDRGLKRRLYERAGVPEYWIVDADRNIVEPFALDGARYRAGAVCTESVRLAARPGVEIDLLRVWAE